MKSIIKITLVILLFLCLVKMPYGYYQLVRFAAFAGFAFLAYQSLIVNHKLEMLIYIFLGLLFQPFFKIALGRELWNIVDVIVGLGLIISVSLNLTKSKSKF